MRNKSLNDGKTPDRLQGGGRMVFNFNEKTYLGANYINLFDIPKTVSKTSYEKYTNGVATVNAHIDAKLLYVFGEGGVSSIDYTDTSDAKTVDVNGTFFEIGLGKLLAKEQLKTELSFRRVDQNFFSAGAQSKRINYTSQVNVLPTVGQNSYARTISLLDLVTDDAIYNQAISFGLMDYEMIFNNVTPYGKATPNRQGFDLLVSYANADGKYDTKIDAQFLQDVAGQGTDAKKSYLLARWSGNVNFDKMYHWDKSVSLSAGYQFAMANRLKSIITNNQTRLLKQLI